MNDVALVTAKAVPSVPTALKALAQTECELDSAETYAAIQKIERAAEALKVLFREVAEVKAKAEDVVLLANHRIGRAIQLIPKSSGTRGQLVGMASIGPRRDARANAPTLKDRGVNWSKSSRLQKLAKIPKTELKALATKLREVGKDATVHAVLREVKEDEIQAKKAAYVERADRGGTATSQGAKHV
jgi:hypothetical protein